MILSLVFGRFEASEQSANSRVQCLFFRGDFGAWSRDAVLRAFERGG